MISPIPRFPFARRRRRLFFGVVLLPLIVLLFLARIWFRRAAWASSSAQPASIEVGGRTRAYYLRLPPSYVPGRPLPLVFVLHGAGQSPSGAERMSGMTAKAAFENFIVVYPAGTGRVQSMPTWNSGACCGYAMQNQVDDVAFIRALLDKIERQYSVDPRRVYATGISNGGMMSYRLACDLADCIAAVAPVEGAQDTPCHPANPVSVLVFHGTDDHLVPYDGGSTPFQIGSKRTDTSVAETVAFWVHENGCSAAPGHDQASGASADVYTGCKEGTGVTLYTIPGGHHSWPGTSLSHNELPATDLIWSFFAAHPKP
jgi:polyhydroxybutyrate depolymerase